ncbi:HPP family protein [Alkalilimnicola sp. S0819]|uniref:HPP family protein n=1 Tax=Alkalilimnicola sp. S0819 TaxID=2613922 RepID=UPI001D0264DD|nr:HPP family protein [Alkalilimnicola sp. S0819]
MSSGGETQRWRLVRGVLRRMHLERVSERFDPTLVLAAFNFVNGGVSIGLIAAVALWTGESFIFPSLGATAFILFYMPLAAPASPRNVLLGHLIGALAGWASLALFGLLDAAPAVMAGMDWPRVGATALSLAVTTSLMALLRVAHPPAGATTLIVSLGLMPQLSQIPVLMAAVLLLLAQALVLNRLAGLPYPWWARQAGPGAQLDIASGGAPAR